MSKRIIAITIDVEWAHPLILQDVIQLLDDRNIKATLFCTHEGLRVGNHERALHPNYDRGGDTMKVLETDLGQKFARLTDNEIYRHIVQRTKAFCPEAIGVRGHNLYYTFALFQVYRDCGLHYDSSYFLPFQQNISPFLKQFDILELPIYYMDHHDLLKNPTQFDVRNLCLESAGLKIFNFHPNMLYINAPNNELYLQSKSVYHDPEKLQTFRHQGKGVRTLFLDLLDEIKSKNIETKLLCEINNQWRKLHTDTLAAPSSTSLI